MKNWLLLLLYLFTLLSFAQNKDGHVILIPRGSHVSKVNWTTQYIETEVSYKIDTLRFRVRKQAVKMAVKNAQVVGRRKLLEIVQELKVNKRVKVYNLIEQNKKLRSTLKSQLKKAEIVGEPIEKEGEIFISMKIPIYGDEGIAFIIHKELVRKPLGKSIQNSVVFIVTSSIPGTVPSLFPKIADGRGNLIIETTQMYTFEAKYQLPSIRNSTLTHKDERKKALMNGQKVLEAHRDSRGDFVLKGKNAETFKSLIKGGIKVKEAVILLD